MRFTFVTVALAAVAGLVQGQTMTSKPASGTMSASKMATTSMTGNPNILQLCVTYGLAIPTCGTSALVSLASKIGNCTGLLDFDCQCQYSKQIQDAASSAVIATCGLDKALVVQGAAASLCQCVNANNAPITSANGSAGAMGAAPGIARARPTDLMGLVYSLGGVLAAGLGVVVVL